MIARVVRFPVADEIAFFCLKTHHGYLHLSKASGIKRVYLRIYLDHFTSRKRWNPELTHPQVKCCAWSSKRGARMGKTTRNKGVSQIGVCTKQKYSQLTSSVKRGHTKSALFTTDSCQAQKVTTVRNGTQEVSTPSWQVAPHKFTWTTES